MRESRPTMQLTLLNTFNQFLDMGFRRYIADENLTSLTFTLTNGSTLLFMAEGYDQDKELNRFRGLEINGAFIDEVNEIREVTFDKLIERSGSWFHSPGCPSKIIATCNPTQGWVKKRFYDPWKQQTLPKGYAYIPAKITDNPHIPKQYMESLTRMNRFQYEVFVNGSWDINMKTGGEFYKCFELNAHVGQTAYNPEQALHISFDENVNPYLPAGIFQITTTTVKDGHQERTEKHVRMIAEVAGENPRNTIKDVCAEIKRRFPGHNAGVFVYGDATAKKDDVKMEKGHNFYSLVMDALRDYKPTNRVARSNPSVVMRGNWINTILENNIGGITILIGEQCTRTINDFVNTKEASDGTKNKEKETHPTTKVSYQKYGHFTDLFDYFMCSAFQAEYAEYQRGGQPMNITVGRTTAKHGY